MKEVLHLLATGKSARINELVNATSTARRTSPPAKLMGRRQCGAGDGAAQSPIKNEGYEIYRNKKGTGDQCARPSSAASTPMLLAVRFIALVLQRRRLYAVSSKADYKKQHGLEPQGGLLLR
ncbi:hypothetical protein [Bifidobacterium magnum]|uniref:hypothetical protein n=1 Tax=Bifidobacterium magnum TaxID=1692 RepID=UPI0012DF2F31|nr:hypothetical protein [Bifidobacterium magnum]